MPPYTYRIRHRPSGQQYYGVKYGRAANPETFWIKYFTSSEPVKALIAQDGPSAFDVEVRKVFGSKEEAVRHEQVVLRRLRVVNRHDWLNQAMGTGPYRHSGTYTEDEKAAKYATRRGKPKTTEHRAKIAAAHRGKKKPRRSEHTAKIAEANRGKGRRPPSDDVRRKISESLKGRLLSEEARQKMSLQRKGRKLKPRTPEHAEKIAKALRGRTGPMSVRFGKLHTDESKKKMANARRVSWMIAFGGVAEEVKDLQSFAASKGVKYQSLYHALTRNKAHKGFSGYRITPNH